MNLSDIIKNVNSFIGDSSTDRISADERYQALTEATAWLLEELGNEHMTDRAEVQFLPTVMWYKMDNITPYLLTAGQLRFKEEAPDRQDFTRVEPRDIASMPQNRCAYAIERYNSDSYLGIILGDRKEQKYRELIPANKYDSLTYSGINATNIVKEEHAVRFDMAALSQTATGLTTETVATDLSEFWGTGYIIFEIEIPDITDVNSVSVKFGSDLSTDYYLGTVTQDVNGNNLVVGVNTIKVRLADLSTVGTPDNTSVTKWGFQVNHDATKPLAEEFKLSDVRVANPIDLTFKYIFYRVGKDANGDDIIEFTADTDVPFFVERYPQYRYAVAHKAAAALHRNMQAYDSAGSEESLANRSLDRFRKNFSGDRDMPSSSFKLAGISFTKRRIRRR